MKCFNLRALARNGLYLSVLWVFALLTGCALSQFSDNPSSRFNKTELLWDEQIIRGQLDNGLNYLAYPSNKAEDGIRLRLLVDAGSVHETDEQIGVAHMLEHMVFHDSDDYPDGIHAWLKQQGWQTGREINALTQQTRTQYMLRILSDSDVSLNRALNLLANIAAKAHLNEDDWQQERLLVLAEWRRIDSGRAAINEQKRAMIRAGSAFINRPTIGNYAAIRDASASDLRSFYRRWYIPANMTLIVSGNFSKQDLKQALEKEFSSLKNPVDAEQVIAQAKAATILPLNQGFIAGRVSTRVPLAVPLLVLGLKSAINRDADIIGDRSRLMDHLIRKLLVQQALKQRENLPSDIQSLSIKANELTVNVRALTIAARGENPDELINQVIRQLALLRQHGFPQSLFDIAQQKMLKQIDKLIERGDRSDYLIWEDRLVTAVAQQKVAEDLQLRYPRIRNLVAELTREQINHHLQHNWLLADDAFMYLQAGDSVAWSAPDKQSWAALWKTTQTLSAPQTIKSATANKEVVRTLPDWPEAAAKINPAKIWQHSRPADAEQGSEVREWQLDNGDRLVWWPVGGSLQLQAVSEAGYQMRGIHPSLSQLALQLGEQSGLAGWSQQQWRHTLRENGGEGMWHQTPASLNWSQSGEVSELSLWLRQYRALVEQGWVTEEAWQQGKAALLRQQQTLQQRQRDGFIFASDHDTAPQQLAEKITKHDLQQLWQRQLRQPVTWYVVGKAEERQLFQDFARYIEPLSRIPAHASAHQIDFNFAPVLQRSGQHRMAFNPDGLTDDVRIRYQLRAYRQLKWSPQLAKQVEHLAPLVQRALKQRLRTELAGVYSVDFRLRLNPETDRLESLLSFVAAPSEVKMLASEALKTLKNIAPRLPDVASTRRVRDLRLIPRLRLQVLIESDRAQDQGQWLKQFQPDESIDNKQLKKISGQFLPLPERVELFWQENK